MKNLWLKKSVFHQMVVEANNKYPLETGGILAEYRSDDDNDIVVVDMIGPGLDAIHSLNSYTPDYSFHKERIGNIYDESNGLISYLGDWHTHPDAGIYLSEIDKRALRNISNNKHSYIDLPAMIILNNTSGSSKWNTSAWRVRKYPTMFLLYSYEYIALSVIFY